jgi:hypothetical protein
MRFMIDTSAFPLVHITYPSHAELHQIDEFVEALGVIHQRGRMSVLVDINPLDSSKATPVHRKRLAEGLDALTRKNPGIVISEAVVTSSAILRGVFTAYSWLKTDRSYPSKCLHDVATALAWTEARLGKAGLSIGGPRKAANDS